MTKIKLCGLSRPCDIETANELKPEYIGFVFAPKSKRYIDPQKAVQLKELLSSDIQAVGVFVDEAPETVADLLNIGIIDLAQLHGGEDEAYIQRLRQPVQPIISCWIPAREQAMYSIGRYCRTSKDRIFSREDCPPIMSAMRSGFYIHTR